MLICKFAPEKSIKFDLMYAKVSQSDNLLGNPRLQPWGDAKIYALFQLFDTKIRLLFGIS